MYGRLVKKHWITLSLGSSAVVGAGLCAQYGSETVKNAPMSLFRFARAAATVGGIITDYKIFFKSNEHLDRESKEFLEKKSEVHTKTANRLLDLCCSNKGAFIKIGQHIGALEYLVPVEFTQVLQKLHSDAPKSELASVLKVVEEELGRNPLEIFTSFSDAPIGAASLAQVHVATLHTGERVAVKVL